MKTLPVLSATLALLFGLAAPAPAAAAPAVITVTGQGRAVAAPDMATETFTIATDARSAAAATADNNGRYERFMKALAGLGIAATDIRTTGYNVSYTPPPQVQPGQPPQPPQRYGYFVNRSIEVTLHDLTLTGKSIDAAVHAGVTDVGGVTFGVSNRRSWFQRALRDAVGDARLQAEAMAAAAGLRVVRVKSMGQGYPSVVQPRLTADVYQAAPAPTRIEPSNVEVDATVTITYEAQ